jgi:peptidoglycan-N-acetylglucosamine deacetylase
MGKYLWAFHARLCESSYGLLFSWIMMFLFAGSFIYSFAGRNPKTSDELRDIWEQGHNIFWQSEKLAAESGYITVSLNKDAIWRVKLAPQEKLVALTFDDGPSPLYTPQVLRILKERAIPATFFLVGRKVQQDPDLVREEVSLGHVIGNHTWDHHDVAIGNKQKIAQEIQRCEDELIQVVGSPSRYQPLNLFRPPHGYWDEETYDVAKSEGYHMILWTVTLEHAAAKTPQAMAQRVLDKVRPGMIILAHDGEPAYLGTEERTMEALPLLLDGLKKQGYRFVTVPELLALSEPQPLKIKGPEQIKPMRLKTAKHIAISQQHLSGEIKLIERISKP